MEGLQALHFPFSKGKFEVLIDGTDKLKQGLLRQLEVLGGRRVRFGAQRGDGPTATCTRGQGALHKANQAAPGRQGHTLAI